MTDFSRVPRLVRAGFVVLDRATGVPRRTLRFQFNPDQFTRTLELVGEEAGAGTPPAESFTLEAELNADEQPGLRLVTGVGPRIAAIAALVTPRVEDQRLLAAQAANGLLELKSAPAELILFHWGLQSVAPVRVTELRVTEEAFAFDLSPIRAKINLGLRVLRAQDLGFDTLAGGLALAYQLQRQALADIGRGDP